MRRVTLFGPNGVALTHGSIYSNEIGHAIHWNNLMFVMNVQDFRANPIPYHQIDMTTLVRTPTAKGA